MKTHISSSSQSGFGHIGIILAVVGVLVVGGLVAWRYLGANKSSSTASGDTSLAQQLANAKCEYDDKDLCKFFVSWKQHDNYRMVSSSVDKNEGATTSITYDVQGDKTYSVIKSPAFNSTTITVGARTTYTLAANGTWWKQTLPEAERTPDSESVPTVELDEPSDKTDEAAPKTEYKALGKEACGKLTCFKYQVVNPDSAGTTEYIWFDDKDYQLRRSTSDSAEYSSDMTFTYDNVSVKVPTSYKELAPNQVLMPGASEPTTIPTAADFQ